MLSSTRRISQQESTRLWILTVCVVATLSGCFVTPALGAPAKLDAIAPPPQSPFPLETQPTQFSEAIAAALKSDIGVRNDGGKSHPSAVDSYGNPIETLKPIDTPDGRKVISAQGLQFEIPNYASGITEIKQPADDLLPPFIDHTASNKIKDNKAIPTATLSNANPFLPAHNSGARPFATKSTDKFTGTSTTTTTTTTTTAATPVEENPFDSATLPPWLTDFDYPDLGPGVAFIYEAEDSNSDVSNDLLPPSQLTAEAADTTKPVFISSSPSSFNSFQISPSSTNRHETTFASASTSPTRTFTFNNFPSKVTTTVKPLSIQNTFAQVPNSNNNNYNQEAVTSPPVLFIPPNAEAESNIDTAAVNDISKSQLQPAATAGQTFSKKPSSSSFNKNFAAPFEPTTVPGSADSDQDFGSSTKTTFTKSNEGKVISNNIFGNNGGITAATKQFGLSTASSTTGQASLQKELQHSTFSGSLSTFNKAVTPGGFSSFTSTQQTNFNSAGSVKYTGGFGGAPGVLGSGKFGSAVNTDGSIRTATNLTFGQAPTAAPKQTTSPSFVSRIGIPATGVTATALGTGVNKYQGTFGGPPGVLTPFDSVKSG